MHFNSAHTRYHSPCTGVRVQIVLREIQYFLSIISVANCDLILVDATSRTRSQGKALSLRKVIRPLSVAQIEF